MNTNPTASPAELLPVRMLNEYVYCPRLFALEHISGEWASSADTEEGRSVHRRVDKPSEAGLPEPEEDPDRPRAIRSVYLGDPALGLVAKIDLVEAQGDHAVPIDYKKGELPSVPEGAWPPERVQVCAQGLLLRAHGYRCEQGVLYFAKSKKRVPVVFDEALIKLTLDSAMQARALVADPKLPPPLVESPKCQGCSLVGICLPDEQNLLTGNTDTVRPLMPPRDDAVPLYVQLQGGSLSKDHDEIVVKERGTEKGRVRLEETSRVVVLGNVSVTTPLLAELAERDVPVSFHSYSGWFQGLFRPASGHNVLTRIAQHRVSANPELALEIAKAFVHAKILNTRVLLRRNAADLPSEALDRLKDSAEEALKAPDNNTLMGCEGAAARLYFEHFHRMIKGELRKAFHFDGRNRRPPRDPVNALLSFIYACLAREITTTTMGIGLDPWVGFLHQPRPGRPALALDLMEEFRPVIGDSVVINAINNGVVQAGDFQTSATGTAMGPAGKKRFLQVYERRLDELATHPVFGTQLSYRRILEVQARLLGKVLLGDLKTYPEFRIR